MLMFTGFLGAGKTTLLRELLDLLADQEIESGVVLNDRENAYIDKMALKNHAADIRALTGSCVCCEGFNDLIDVIMKISKTNHDIVLIELNGTADPIPLQESFTVLESKFCLRPRWQVCVIDARHFRKRRKFNDLESLQLETASHYYISHNSELSEEKERQIEQGINDINSVATRTTAAKLVDAISQAIGKNRGHTLTKLQSEGLDQVTSKFDLTQFTQRKNSNHERHRLAHEFTGCEIIIPEPVNQERVINWLDRLPTSVIRAKALLTLEGDLKKLHLFERVGMLTSPESISAQRKRERPCSGIFIGSDLDPIEILTLTKEHLHPECHFPELETENQEVPTSV